MRRLLFLLVLVALASAQTVGPVSITSIQCARIAVSSNTAVVGIQVVGTWSGTLQPEISVSGQTPANIQVTPSTSTTPQSTITADGIYTTGVAGGSTFLVCGNTVGSGTASVYLNAAGNTTQ